MNIPQDDPNRKSTIEWMRECVDEARKVAKTGDLNPINALGRSPGFAAYINNVNGGFLTEAQFAAQFAPHVAEVEKQRKQYELLEAVPENNERLSRLEESLKKLEPLITKAVTLMEAAALTESETTNMPGDPDAGHAPAPTPAPVPPVTAPAGEVLPPPAAPAPAVSKPVAKPAKKPAPAEEKPAEEKPAGETEE